MISKVEVSGNTVTPVLSAEVDGATGYDFVLSRSADPTDTAARVDVSKNIPKGTYYVGLHAYNRTSETGVKVFSKWSTPKKVTINK